MYGRTDVSKYVTGLRTCRNAMVLKHGGVSNRSGTEFVCEVNDSTKAVRLIEFIFNSSQTYILEFGENYIRVIKDGVQQREAAKTITGITAANPAVVTTSAAHGYSNGDEVYIYGLSEMTELNGRWFKVNNVASTTYELQDMAGVNFDASAYTAETTGGSCEKVYQITTTYTEAEIFDIDYVQSADVVTLVHPAHPPAELSRLGDINWTLTDINFIPDIAKPTGISASAGGAGSNSYRYVVTAIDAETFEESIPGTITASTSITGASNADPCVITTASHSYAANDTVYIDSITGMEELNGRIFTVANPTGTTFELEGVDSQDYGSYSTGGTIQKAYAEVTSAAAPTSAAPHVISWTKVASAAEYNIYKESNGVYGLIGVARGTSFNDIGINADTSDTPPNTRNPFLGTDNYPSAVTYVQQRLAFANTNNSTEKVYLSRTANFKNFTTSSPIQDDDSITFTMAGRQVNAVQSIFDIGKLIILTTGGEWAATGNEANIITPTDINARQYSYFGAGDLRPIIIGNSALYIQARNSIIRDLGFDFQVDGYSGNDLTIFSSHLFENYTLVDWSYQQIPNSIVWAIRSDGTVVGLTYIRDQQMLAWHRHDFGSGLAKSVATVPEGSEDFPYFVVERTINGRTVKYIERFTTRRIVDIDDLKMMDSHLSYDGRNTNTSHTMTLSGGTDWVYTEDLTLTSSASYFASTDVGNAIHILDSSGDEIRCTIKSYTSPTVVTVNSNRTVPVAFRSVALSTWEKAVDQVTGLWHLEGEDVSVFADGFVVASPNNDSYDTVTVTNGTVTLDKPYSVIHVGLPYISDIETLDIDTANAETLMDKNMNVQYVTLFVESSRGIWVGAKPPASDTVDPLEGLVEFKLRNDEVYDSPTELKTDKINVNIKAEWNSNGRIFLRQVDPIPMTILSVSPSGFIPLKG